MIVLNTEAESWISESLQGIIETLFDYLIDDQFIISGQTEIEFSGGRPVYPVVDQGMLHLQNVFNPFILFLATLGILISAVRLLWYRRLDPMMDLVRGLLTVIITTFAGIFFIHLLMGFSRALGYMITSTGTFEIPNENEDSPSETTTRNFIYAAKQVYPSIMRVALEGDELGFITEAAQEAVTYMIGLAVVFGLIAQIVVLVLLQAIIYLIACLLPLAAASTMIPGLKIFPKVIGWLLACLLYKPLILLVYLAGLVILAASDDSLFKFLVGAAVMLLATGALPVLMKLMSSGSVWALALAAGGISSIGGGGGGGGGGDGGGNDGTTTSGNNSGSIEPASYSGGGNGLQEQAQNATQRANDVGRNLDDGAPNPEGGPTVTTADLSGTGAQDTNPLGTQGGPQQVSTTGSRVNSPSTGGGLEDPAPGATEQTVETGQTETNEGSVEPSGAGEAIPTEPAVSSTGDTPGGAITTASGDGGATSDPGVSGPPPSSGSHLPDGADGRMI